MPISDVAAAIRWWLILFLLGITTFPITYYLLQTFPGKGYAFTKAVGLLAVSYIFWLLGSLGIVDNDLGGILLAWILVASSAYFLFQKDKSRESSEVDLLAWVRLNWRYMLFVELFFLFVFSVWVWARAQNPAIVATEKPMEFAFLNSASRSPQIPPLDPWLSGFAISYYYFGYVMASILSRLAVVPESIGFNLMTAWVAAGTSLGAFGVLYNVVKVDFNKTKRLALTAGLIAAFAIPIAGNLEILLEIAYAKDVGSEQFWNWLDVRDFSTPSSTDETPRYLTSQWWWWRSSRVIHEYHLSGRAEEGLEPITEFPSFSLILGDLHPHVLALPYAFLGIALAYAWWLRSSSLRLDFRLWFKKDTLSQQFQYLKSNNLIFILATATLLGGLSFLNTWDVFIYLLLILGAYILNRQRQSGKLGSAGLAQTATLAFILIFLSILLYLPFYIGFRSQAGPPFLLPMTMQPTRLAHFFIIFGMYLIPISVMLVSLIIWASRHMAKPERRQTLLTSFGSVIGLIIGLFVLMLGLGWIIGLSSDGRPRVVSLLQELQIPFVASPEATGIASHIAWATSAVAKLTPFFVEARISQPLLILILGLMITATIYLGSWSMRRVSLKDGRDAKISRSLPFIFLLIGTGALLALGPEFVYLRDNFGQRLNTIFKFYYQAWVLFGISAIYGLVYLLQKFRIVGWITLGFFGLLLMGTLLFPYYGVRSRALEYQGAPTADNRLPPTIDGMAYLKSRNPDEYEAISWLRNNVVGSPVIAEAVGGQYSLYGRVAASTGLPTILGWAGHEYQWRGNTPEPAIREPLVQTIYSIENWTETERILNDYDIAYIYFGSLEKSTYDPRSEEKFAQNTMLAFQNNTVSIYRWQAPEEELQ